MQFTPGGAIEIANILGKEETLRRLDLSIQQLENACLNGVSIASLVVP